MQNSEFRIKNCGQTVGERDFEGFEPDDSALIDEVVSMGKVWDTRWKEKMFMNL